MVNWKLMRLLVIYRPNSEHARSVESFLQSFQERHEDAKVEVLNVDSREGNAMATLYDVMQYPCILVTRDDGSLLKSWEGPNFPLMDEVAYYTLGQA